MIEKFILLLMILAPSAEINTDATLRTEIAGHIKEAGEVYSQDPMWLTYRIYKESGFRVSIVSKSKRKEFGLCQVHGVAREICKTLEIDLSTARGQVHCMAALYEHGELVCGSKKASRFWYRSGKCRPSAWLKKDYRRQLRRFENLKGKLL